MTSRRRNAGAVCFALCSVLLAAEAHAQSDPQAAAAAQRGSTAFTARRYGEARLAFEEAVQREPTPQRLFALGQSCRLTSRYVEAIDAFERYLAAPEPNALPERLTAIRDQVAEMRRLLATLTLHATPASALVTLDGRTITSPLERAAIDPGPHVLELSAEGHRTERREINADSGAQLVFEVTLAAVAVEAPRLVVEPSVASAMVRIDGQTVGAGRVAQSLTPGDHAVEIEAPGYEVFRRTVRLGSTGVTRMDASLQHRGLPGWVLPTAIAGGVLLVGGTVLGVWAATRDTSPELHPVWYFVDE